MEERSFLSIRQAAKISSLSIRFLYEICAKKQLRHYKVGKRIVVDSKDLESFICQNEVEVVRDWGERLGLK